MRHAVLRLIRQFYGTVENAQKGNMSPLCHILRLGSRGDTSEFGNILGEAERRLGSRSRGEQGLGDLGFDPTEAERRIPRKANGAKRRHIAICAWAQ